MMTGFLLLVIALGFVLSLMYNNQAILYGAIILSLVMNVGAYWFSDSLVLSIAGARRIEKKSRLPRSLEYLKKSLYYCRASNA